MGKKPSKQNLFIGNPLFTSAGTKAVGPGRHSTRIFTCMHSLTRRKAGSETPRRSGVSQKSHHFPLQHLVHKVPQYLMLVVLMIGRERLNDLVMIQQLKRIPRVFSKDQVNLLQYLQRTQGDISKVSNWGGD